MREMECKLTNLQLESRDDRELNKLLGGVTIAQDGALPNMQAVLLPKKTEKPVGRWAAGRSRRVPCLSTECVAMNVITALLRAASR
ncbi:Histone H2A [Taenia solium]|eukprot:TsM_000352300 transcript=TsM_000352300 gene=TsM_000352300